jgi:hypothetical protein
MAMSKILSDQDVCDDSGPISLAPLFSEVINGTPANRQPFQQLPEKPLETVTRIVAYR